MKVAWAVAAIAAVLVVSPVQAKQWQFQINTTPGTHTKDNGNQKIVQTSNSYQGLQGALNVNHGSNNTQTIIQSQTLVIGHPPK